MSIATPKTCTHCKHTAFHTPPNPDLAHWLTRKPARCPKCETCQLAAPEPHERADK